MRYLPLLLLALAACSKDAKDRPSGESAPTAASDDAAVAAWRKAGLAVSALTEVDGGKYAAQACRGGTVAGVDIVLCRYDQPAQAQAAEDGALATLGEATGAALSHDARLLVVADRRQADPTGRTIDAITRAFMK